MRLRLHPCEGTGKQWRITLEIANTWLAADVGERVTGPPEWRFDSWQINEIDTAMREANAIAAVLGLKLHPGSRDPHWTLAP